MAFCPERRQSSILAPPQLDVAILVELDDGEGEGGADDSTQRVPPVLSWFPSPAPGEPPPSRSCLSAATSV